MIKRDSPIPLYHQLLEIFYERLQNGDWAPGLLIPPETELAKEYDVSVITVRNALLTLEREGRLIRRRGKGTIVAERELNTAKIEIGTFRDLIDIKDRKVEYRVLEKGITKDYKTLPHKIPDPEVFYVRRVCNIDDRPFYFHTIFVGSSLLDNARIDKWNSPDLEDRLIEYLEPANEVQEVIESITLGHFEANILGEKEGKLALLIERTVFGSDKPVIFERCILGSGKITIKHHKK